MRFLIIAAGLALSACAGTDAVNTANQTLTQAQSVLAAAQSALTDYGIAKGIGLVAASADPALGPAEQAIFAVTDPKVAQLQVLVNAGSADLTAIQNLVAAINAQAQAIRLQGAPTVKVIPSAPATSSQPSAWLNPSGSAQAGQPSYAMD